MIEILIVLVVIPIVVAGISAAIITGLKDQQGVSGRLSDSHDAQLMAAYFIPDIEDATSVSNAAGGASYCQSFGGQVELILQEPSVPNIGATSVYYVYDPLDYGTPPTPAPANVLVRVVCNPAGTAPAVGPTGYVPYEIVSYGMTSAPTFTIGPCPSSLPINATCTPTGGSNGGVSGVTLTATESNSNFNYSLTATPRQWDPESAAAGGGPLPYLLLLGPNALDNSTNLIDFIGANSSLSMTGNIAVDSKAAGSVLLFNNNQIAATGGIDIYDCNPSGGTCNNNAVTPAVGSTVTPNPTSMVSPVSDPLSMLPTPPVISTNATPCTTSGSVMSCTAGLYPTGLQISTPGETINFGPGNYQFGNPNCVNSACANTGLGITGAGDTINFATGIYTFEGATADNNSCNLSTGLHLTNKGGINISGGGDTVQETGSGGVLFYVAGGAANFGCGATPAMTVNLPPMTTGTYANTLLFTGRSPSVTQIVVLEGFTTTGTIYAPGSYVESIGSATSSTGPVVAQQLQLSGSLQVS